MTYKKMKFDVSISRLIEAVFINLEIDRSVPGLVKQLARVRETELGFAEFRPSMARLCADRRESHPRTAEFRARLAVLRARQCENCPGPAKFRPSLAHFSARVP